MILATVFAFAQDATSEWAKDKIEVDGNANDWKLPLKHYDNQTGLFFDFKNDNNNLYLCFQTKDEMNEAKILRSGMKVILSNKVNGKHKSIISYPLPVKHELKQNNPDEIKPDPLAPQKSRRASFLAADTLMEVKGFTNNDGIISIKNSDIHAAINFDSSNALTYEISIPLKELFGNDYNGNDVSKDISLNVIVNAMPNHSENGASGFSGRSGHGGRMGAGYGGMQHEGSRMEGEEQNQNQFERAALLQKTEFKQKFTLATPQS